MHIYYLRHPRDGTAIPAPRRHSAPPPRRCHWTQDQPARIVDENVNPNRRKPKTNADCSRAKESSRADRHLIEQRSHAALNRGLHHSIIQIRRVCRCKPGSIEGYQPAAGMPNIPASEQVWAAHAQDGRSVQERSALPARAPLTNRVQANSAPLIHNWATRIHRDA